MQRLNYSTQAVVDLIEFAKLSVERGDPTTGRDIATLARLLHSSVKFMLPYGGRVIEHLDYRKDNPLREFFRLPYKRMAIEFAMPQSGGLGFDGQPLVKIPKRIAYCEYLEPYEVQQRFLGKSSEDEKEKFDFPAIYIHPINFFSKENDGGDAKWMPNLSYGFFKEGITFDVEYNQGEDIYSSKDVTYIPFSKIGSDAYNSGLYSTDDMVQDNSDEVNALMQLLHILQCKNVVVQEDEAPEKLNKKRLKSNKIPFYDYKVLTVKVAKKKGNTHGDDPKRASPRMHLRRGHSRTYENGDKIWISDMTIAAEGELLNKEYKVMY